MYGELENLKERSASIFLNTYHMHYHQKGCLGELIVSIKSHRPFLLSYTRRSTIRKPARITMQLNPTYWVRPETKSNCY